jgi:hypothetical protein
MFESDEKSQSLEPIVTDVRFAEDDLTSKFKTRLWKEYGLRPKDLDDWQYAGGDYNEKEPWHAKFKKEFKIKTDWPERADECVCGVEIMYNCFISNRERDWVLVIGRCCINKFIGPNRRRCEICYEPHRNRKRNMCKACYKTSKCKGCGDILDRDEPHKAERMCINCKSEYDYSEFERQRAEYEEGILRAAKEIKERRKAEEEREAAKLKFVTCNRCNKKQHRSIYKMCWACSMQYR